MATSKSFRKAQEYYNYKNTSLGLRRRCTLQDEQQGNSIMTNIEDVIERFEVLYGEITSGKKNINLINEFRELLYYFYKEKFVNKQYYKQMMQDIYTIIKLHTQR